MNQNIVIIGVGGQGTLLASKILGKLGLSADMDVKVSEVHGMAQRGGSVVTFVRIGENVRSPLVEYGQADFVLCFEKLEAMRALPYVKADGAMIVNTQEMKPMPVIIGAQVYPSTILEELNTKCKVISLDALALARQSGSFRAVNIVLMGAMARLMEFEKQLWLDAITACVPPKTLEINLKAFEKGYMA